MQGHTEPTAGVLQEFVAVCHSVQVIVHLTGWGAGVLFPHPANATSKHNATTMLSRLSFKQFHYSVGLFV